MLELRVITKAEHDTAKAAPLGVSVHRDPRGCVTAGVNGYFCSFVINTITKDPAYAALGKTPQERANAIKREGLTIRTTLDEKVQDAAFKSLTDAVPMDDPSRVGTAAATVEPGTGKILAMSQNRQYDPGKAMESTEINYSVDHEFGSGNGFQVGSTFKAFVLADWLAKGKGLYDYVDATKKERPASDYRGCKGEPTTAYNPSNSGDGTETGSMSVLDATRNSVNVAFADMSTQLSLCDIAATATKLGVHKGHVYDAGDCQKATQGPDYGLKLPDCTPSMILGSVDIAPLTMAAAYAGFAADGTYCKPLAVTSITDRNQKEIKIPGSSCNQALDSSVARGVTYALKTVLTNGTARGQGIGRPAAGKTGTTDNSMDTWFVGYTPQRSTAVWVGDNPNPPPDEKRRSLNDRKIGGSYRGNIYGATIAAPIWHDIMRVANDGLPEKDWGNPPGKMLEGNSVRVPNVVGQSLDAARAQLENAGFRVRIGRSVPSAVPPGFVADTDPRGGSRMAPNGTITLKPGDGTGDPNGGQQPPVRPGGKPRPGGIQPPSPAPATGGQPNPGGNAIMPPARTDALSPLDPLPPG
jgi:membrane peptidoglycan carboxypeptidase